MKKRVWRIVAIIAGAFALFYVGMMLINIVSASKENYANLTDEQKDEDILYLHNILEEAYPFWHEVEQGGVDRDEVFSEYRERVQKTGTDTKYYERLGQYLSQFDGFGHLGIMSPSLYQMHVDIYKENADAYRLWLNVLEGDMTVKAYAALAQPDESTESFDETSSTVETKMLDEQTAYIKIPSFQYQSYETDRATLFAFYDEIKSMDNLIIDIRGNTGGSGKYWNELIVDPNIKEDLTDTRYALFKDSEMFRNFLEAEISPEDIKPISELPNFTNPSYDYQSAQNQ